jgi:hypothetical protein
MPLLLPVFAVPFTAGVFPESPPPRSLLRFAQKISKNRRLGGAYEAILPCKLHGTKGSQQPINRGF